jgi:NAD(P)-dependent dehydrogenase (short-subunit alcohol dehydrogenase family)
MQLFQTNILGNMHFINLFIPMVLKGKAKKVIALTSGHADLEFINEFEAGVQPLYAASKAAMNVIIGKYNAEYKKDGVLFVSVSPGVIDTGKFVESTLFSLTKPF